MSILPSMLPDMDSPVAARYVPSWGAKRGVYRRRIETVAIVIHTTGNGPVRRWRALPDVQLSKRTPLDVAVEMYASGKVGDNGAHYVVGQDGKCVQTCQERFVAWHVGGGSGAKYLSGRWDKGFFAKRRYAWFHRKWPMHASPAKLAGGRLWNGVGGPPSCNAQTIGIEVVPQLEGPKAPWSLLCWDTVARLVWDIATRNQIPLAADHVVTHSDASPVARTTLGGVPWDPRPEVFSWDQLKTEFNRLGVVLATCDAPSMISSGR